MTEFVPDPQLVDALAASIHSAGVAAMVVAVVFLLLAPVLMVISLKEAFSDDGFLFVIGVTCVFVALAVFAVHMDDVQAPRYEAIKQLTHAHNTGKEMP